MKKSPFLRTAAIAAMILGISIIESLHAQSAGGTMNSSSTPEGYFTQHGNIYFVRGGQITRVDFSSIPPGQMLTTDGRLIAIPRSIASSSVARSIAPGAPAGPSLGVSGSSAINSVQTAPGLRTGNTGTGTPSRNFGTEPGDSYQLKLAEPGDRTRRTKFNASGKQHEFTNVRCEHIDWSQ